ncbi:phosphate ABC transporter permease PstA [Roseovarius tibetensis]|uniref:phosphate ABC transporter permease PstA n=1 Tax=Roseovarius tibetensis TaxID=2685897 RepID=UPI003D7FB399
MTDITPDHAGSPGPNRATEAVRQSLSRRNRKQKTLQGIGLAAIGFALLMLFILIASLVATGHHAFTQTHIEVEVYIDPDEVPQDNPSDGNYQDLLLASMAEYFPDLDISERSDARELSRILSDRAQFTLRDRVVNNPDLIGETITLNVPTADDFDQLNKGLVERDTAQERRRVDDAAIARFDSLDERGMITKPLNWALLTNADSRFPEVAGLKGAIVGSFWALLTCFIISFPLGIGAAIYLEEFAPKNRLNDLIEVNINNLAAVPSVVFGLLALAVFIGWFGMPRSAPFVGGMTLALMTLPTIIIATRNALKAVPPSIREAALGVGASKHQVVFHHVLPLAMPGILTGTIIGLAQALGETAPLLLIGMNAFITSAPSGPFDSATALPTQIFIWADSPERGFVSRTSAAILVLLTFLITMNAIAIFLRQKFERKW